MLTRIRRDRTTDAARRASGESPISGGYDLWMLWARDKEMAAIDAQLQAARESRGGPLRLTGEAGIGKSALLDYAERRASGMTVLRARAAEDEAALPYATLHQLLRGVLPRLERLPVPQARALGV